MATTRDALTPKILIVDDDPGLRASLASWARVAKIKLQVASNAVEGIDHVARNRFDAILLDIRMPGLSGIDAIGRLRELDPDVSILMYSGESDGAASRDSMNRGANRYIVKGGELADLEKAVLEEVDMTRNRRNLKRALSKTELINDKLKSEVDSLVPLANQGLASVELVHDMGTPLTTMYGTAQDMLELVEKDDVSASELVGPARRIVRLSNHLFRLTESWAQAGAEPVGPINAVQAARELSEIVLHDYGSIKVFTGSELNVMGNVTGLLRLLQNLVVNSFEADAEKVSIEFRDLGGQVEIKVVDDGSGMSEDTLRKALNGGFTTKRNGVGVGLRIVKEITRLFDGTFALSSDTEGTVATVILTKA